MKVKREPRASFDKFPDRAVAILPFDAASKQRSCGYLARLNQMLAPYGVVAQLFGSVELEIAGKGEWEFAAWLNDEQWYPVLTALVNHFGSVYEITEDFVLFNDAFAGTEVEVMLMRGDKAEQNQAIMDYWRKNSTALKEYEQGKYKHAHSKREYYWWKSNLIADILESL